MKSLAKKRHDPNNVKRKKQQDIIQPIELYWKDDDVTPLCSFLEKNPYPADKDLYVVRVGVTSRRENSYFVVLPNIWSSFIEYGVQFLFKNHPSCSNIEIRKGLTENVAALGAFSEKTIYLIPQMGLYESSRINRVTQHVPCFAETSIYLWERNLWFKKTEFKNLLPKVLALLYSPHFRGASPYKLTSNVEMSASHFDRRAKGMALPFTYTNNHGQFYLYAELIELPDPALCWFFKDYLPKVKSFVALTRECEKPLEFVKKWYGALEKCDFLVKSL